MEIDIKKHLAELQNMFRASKRLSELEFDHLYRNSSVEIMLSNPSVLNVSMPLFRGRIVKDVKKGEDLSNPMSFSYVPLSLNEKGLPARERLNYKSQSIFYASATMKTNFKEISKNCSIGDMAFMSKWILKADSNLHLYKVIPEVGIAMDSNGIFCVNDPSIINSEIGTYLKFLGRIILSNELPGKYFASSYIANYIYNANGIAKNAYGPDIKFHYDGILYPSAVSDSEEVNIALKPEFVDSNLSLEYVIRGALSSDMKSVLFKEIGINENDRIIWFQFYLDKKSIKNVKSMYFDDAGNIVNSSNGQLYDADNKPVESELSALNYLIDRNEEMFFGKLSDIINVHVRENQTVNKSTFDIPYRLQLYFKLKNWNLSHGVLVTPVTGVVYEFDLQFQLRQISPKELAHVLLSD